MLRSSNKKQKVVTWSVVVLVFFALIAYGAKLQARYVFKREDGCHAFMSHTGKDAVINGKSYIEIRLPPAKGTMHPINEENLKSFAPGLYRCFVFKENGRVNGVVLDNDLDHVCDFTYEGAEIYKDSKF